MHIYYLQIMYRSLHIMLLSRDQHKGGRKEEKIKYTISLTPEPKNSILKCFQYFNLYTPLDTKRIKLIKILYAHTV